MKRYILLALFLVLGTAVAVPSVMTSHEVSPASTNPGGTVQVIVTITNSDPVSEITSLSVSATSNIVGISVSGSSTLGNLPPGGTTSTSFAVQIGSNVAPGVYVIEVTGTYSAITGSDRLFTMSVPISVSYRSELEISAKDTQVNAGATVDLPIVLTNSGRGLINGVVLTLSSPGNEIYPVDDVRKSLDTIPVNEPVQATFKIRASDLATPGIKTLLLTATYTDAAGGTQTDTQQIGVTVLSAGTEIVVDSIDSNLEPGQSGSVKIGVKNVGASNLEKLYFSLNTVADLAAATAAGTTPTLMVRGANEKIVDSLAVGEVKYVEFDFDVSQDAVAFPVGALLSVTYEREGSQNQIVATKPLGIVIDGKPDLELVDHKISTSTSNQIEISVANYGNKDANAVKVDAISNGEVFGTGFTDTIKVNKNKIFSFDMPKNPDVTIRIEYKDYSKANGTAVKETQFTLAKSEIAQSGDNTGGIVLVVVIVAILAWWYFRKKKRDGVKIDVSKYK